MLQLSTATFRLSAANKRFERHHPAFKLSDLMLAGGFWNLWVKAAGLPCGDPQVSDKILPLISPEPPYETSMKENLKPLPENIKVN